MFSSSLTIADLVTLISWGLPSPRTLPFPSYSHCRPHSLNGFVGREAGFRTAVKLQVCKVDVSCCGGDSE